MIRKSVVAVMAGIALIGCSLESGLSADSTCAEFNAASVDELSMAMLRSPLVANWKSPPFADVQLVLSRVPPFALACRMR